MDAADSVEPAKRPWWSCRPPFLVLAALWIGTAIAAAISGGHGHRSRDGECLQNLEHLGAIYVVRRATGTSPRSGPALFIEYRQDGDIPYGEEEWLLCPGDQQVIFPSTPEDREEYDHFDPDDPASWGDRMSYAVRDFARFPVQPGAEGVTVIAACRGNSGGIPHHADGLPVLFADGRVEWLDWADIGVSDPPRRGRPFLKWDAILVGPGAPNPDLAKLIPPPRDSD
jgi:hypothetical protein